jgi:hypothetical protein
MICGATPARAGGADSADLGPGGERFARALAWRGKKH